MLISKVLHIFKHHCIILVIDASKQALEALPALDLDINSVAEKIFHWRNTHI